MKKSTKYFLMGAGAVAVGFVAYALLKKDEQADDTATHDEVCTADASASPSVGTSTQEFVERRKRRVAEMRATKMAAQEQAPSLSANDSATTGEQAQEEHIEAADISECKACDLVAEQCAVDTADME